MIYVYVDAWLIRAADLGPDLARKLNKHFRYQWDEKSIIVDTRALLEQMPASLRIEVANVIYKDVIDHTPFFSKKPGELISSILKHVLPIKFRDGDIIGASSEAVTHWMIVKSGTCEAIYTSDGNDHCLMRFTAGSTIGEIGILFTQSWSFELRAATTVEVFYVAKTDLIRVLRDFPKVRDSLRRIAVGRMMRLKLMIQKRGLSLSKQWKKIDALSQHLNQVAKGNVNEHDPTQETPETAAARQRRMSLIRQELATGNDESEESHNVRKSQTNVDSKNNTNTKENLSPTFATLETSKEMIPEDANISNPSPRQRKSSINKSVTGLLVSPTDKMNRSLSTRVSDSKIGDRENRLLTLMLDQLQTIERKINKLEYSVQSLHPQMVQASEAPIHDHMAVMQSQFSEITTEKTDSF